MMVVIVGFVATVQLLIMQTVVGHAPSLRSVVTFVLALGVAVRYWWVILLLPWPARLMRMVLLLALWSALPVVAITTTDAAQWGFAIAALLAIGSATEVYNTATKQWLVGSEEMSASLKIDHIVGAASAAAASLLVLLLALLRSAWLDVAIPLMLLADWARLVMMIHRHRRFIDQEQLL